MKVGTPGDALDIELKRLCRISKNVLSVYMENVRKKLPDACAMYDSWVPVWCDPKFPIRNGYSPTVPLSVTSLTQFRRCREHFRLRYIDRVSPNWDSYPAEWGDFFHEANAEYCENKDHKFGDFTTIEDDVAEIVLYLRKERMKQRGKMTAEEYDDFNLMASEVRIVLTEYLKHYHKFNQSVNWISREEKLTTSFKVNGCNIPFTCYMDGVYSTSSDDTKMILFETKTVDKLDVDNTTAKLYNDLQTMTYLSILLKTHSKMPLGITYDKVRRPSISQKKTETLSDFLGRLQADIKAEPTKYFARWQAKPSKRDLLDWQRRVFFPLLQDFLRWFNGFFRNLNGVIYRTTDPYSNPFHYMNDAELVSMFGRSKFFDALIHDKWDGLTQAIGYGKGRKAKEIKTAETLPFNSLVVPNALDVLKDE